MPKLTIATARAEIRAHGCTLRVGEDREFRVCLKGGTEASAYYTNDLADAVGTAAAMARWARGNAGEAEANDECFQSPPAQQEIADALDRLWGEEG